MQRPLWVTIPTAALCLVAGTVLAVRSAAIAEAEAGRPSVAQSLGMDWRVTALAQRAHQRQDVPPLSEADRRAALNHIRRWPLDAAPFLVLGLDATRSDPSTADRLVDAALTREPRTPEALLWKVRRALASAKTASAARYAARLASIAPENRPALELLAKLANVPDARPVILHALSLSPDWSASLVGMMSQEGVDPAFVYTAMTTGSPGEVNLRDGRENFLANLLQHGEFDRAYVAWISWLPKSALSAVDYLYDGHFTGQPGLPPFNWSLERQPSGTAETGSDGLEITFDGTSDVSLARQTIVLPAGRYRFASSVENQNGQQLGAVPTLLWRVTCLPKGSELTQLPMPVDRAAALKSAPFEVTADCPAQEVDLRSKAVAFPANVSVTIRYARIEAAK